MTKKFFSILTDVITVYCGTRTSNSWAETKRFTGGWGLIAVLLKVKLQGNFKLNTQIKVGCIFQMECYVNP